MKKKRNVTIKKCYNCNDEGSTHEHIIPKFLLGMNEHGLTIPCCIKCQQKLNWLDDYAADYFRFQRSNNSIADYEKWYKRKIIQNGSSLALRLFGDDVVISEGILMHFIHKICVGVAYQLYGKLDDTYRLNIMTNFSKLGGYSQYNNPGEKSYTEEQTIKLLNLRDKQFDYFKQGIRQNSIIAYQIENVKLTYTEKQIIYGALWFSINFYNKFNLLCAVVNDMPAEFAQARNMLISSLPIRIDVDELAQLREMTKQVERGDSIVEELARCPISNESRALRKPELLSLGVPIEDIEKFESSLIDTMENKGGQERLAKMFLEGFKGKYKHLFGE
jgi:hypothetical protein